MISLREVTEGDKLFLFRLLDEREEHVNISHKKMPSYSDHVRFVWNYRHSGYHDYSYWAIIDIKIEGLTFKDAGTIYLTKRNEIGIQLLGKVQEQGCGKEAIKELMKLYPHTRYLANINPQNKRSIEFFENQGFKHIQNTYSLESDSDS